MSAKKKNQGFRTLDEIRESGKTILTPQDVAPILKCQPYNINLTVKENPALLGFPVCMINSRVKIPAAGFLKWAEWAGVGA